MGVDSVHIELMSMVYEIMSSRGTINNCELTNTCNIRLRQTNKKIEKCFNTYKMFRGEFETFEEYIK